MSRLNKGIGNEVRVQQKPKEVNLRQYRGLDYLLNVCLFILI